MIVLHFASFRCARFQCARQQFVYWQSFWLLSSFRNPFSSKLSGCSLATCYPSNPNLVNSNLGNSTLVKPRLAKPNLTNSNLAKPNLVKSGQARLSLIKPHWAWLSLAWSSLAACEPTSNYLNLNLHLNLHLHLHLYLHLRLHLYLYLRLHLRLHLCLSINLSIYQPINLHPSGFIRIILSICVVRFLLVSVCICALVEAVGEACFCPRLPARPLWKMTLVI